MPVAELQNELATLSPPDVVFRWFVERVPAVFAGDHVAHVAFKVELARRLGLSVFDVVVVGSAAVGFSLDPAKNFSAFSTDSDVDIAVASPHHFEIGWRWLRTLGAKRYRLPVSAQSWVKEHETRLVYWGQIATDQLLEHMPFAPDWVPALAFMSSTKPIDGRELTVRLYRDYYSLEAALIHTTRKLRTKAGLGAV